MADITGQSLTYDSYGIVNLRCFLTKFFFM